MIRMPPQRILAMRDICNESIRERCTYLKAGSILDVLDALDAAYKQIDQLDAQVKRGGEVVVPELTGPEMFKILLKAHGGDERCVDAIPDFHKLVAFAVTEWFRENSRTVDASQVLQPGMVGVDQEDLKELVFLAEMLASGSYRGGFLSFTPKSKLALDRIRRAQAGEVKG